MRPEGKRRQYFIEPSFQFKFIMKFCVIVLVSSLLTGAVLFHIFQGSTTVAIENTKIVVKSTADFIFPGLLATLALVAGCSALVAAILSLVSSHKISGPIFRIQREIELVRQGDLRRKFVIRSTDQMQELARSLNTMTNSLREKHLEIGGQCRSLTNFLEEKNFNSSQEDRAKLHQMLKELYEILHYFKV